MKARHIRKLRKEISSDGYLTRRLNHWYNTIDRIKILYHIDDNDSEFTRYPTEQYNRALGIAKARIKWYKWKLIMSDNPEIWENPYKVYRTINKYTPWIY